jgi:hypothetical protein
VKSGHSHPGMIPMDHMQFCSSSTHHPSGQEHLDDGQVPTSSRCIQGISPVLKHFPAHRTHEAHTRHKNLRRQKHPADKQPPQKKTRQQRTTTRTPARAEAADPLAMHMASTAGASPRIAASTMSTGGPGACVRAASTFPRCLRRHRSRSKFTFPYTARHKFALIWPQRLNRSGGVEVLVVKVV